MRRAALLAALLGLACAEIPFSERQPEPTASEGAWGQERVRFTRSGKIYDGFSTNAFVTAVYEPLEAREARVDRLATWRAATPQEREAMLAPEREDAARHEEFLVSLFTPDRADNDLNTSKSIWRVALAVPGLPDLLPVSIHEELIDANLRALYPTIGRFDHVYRVRFPRAPEPLVGRAFTLRLAGSKGQVDLDFSPEQQAAQK